VLIFSKSPFLNRRLAGFGRRRREPVILEVYHANEANLRSL